MKLIELVVDGSPVTVSPYKIEYILKNMLGNGVVFFNASSLSPNLTYEASVHLWKEGLGED